MILMMVSVFKFLYFLQSANKHVLLFRHYNGRIPLFLIMFAVLIIISEQIVFSLLCQTVNPKLSFVVKREFCVPLHPSAKN